MNRRYVVITGAARGIGKAALELFVEKGWFAIGIDRDSFRGKLPKDCAFLEGDVSSEREWMKIQGEVEERTAQLDALVNNAGVQMTKPLVETSLEEWDTVINTNLRSVFLGIKALFPYLSAGNGGAIVNVSSVHAVATSNQIAAYAASKGGMLALTRALAIEFAQNDIRVNAVLPGAVDTEMLRAGLNRNHAGSGSLEDRLEILAKKTVIGSVGKPEEIARAIYFLADDQESSFVTGQPLVVDGGATSRLSTE